MNQNYFSRMIAFLICFIMIIGLSAPACSAGLYSLISGQDLSPIRISAVSPKVISMDTLDDKRISQLNLLLKHFSLSVTIDGDQSRTDFSVDGEQVFSAVSREDNSTLAETYSIESGTIFLHQQDPKSGQNDFLRFAEDYFVSVNLLADGFYPLFHSAPENFSEYSKTEKASMNLSGFGKVNKRVTIVIPGDAAADHFSETLLKNAESEACRSFLKRLTFSGTQKIILLFSEDNQLLRVSYNGVAGVNETDQRKVSLVWRCLRSGTVIKDSLELKTPSVSGYDRDNMEIVRELDMSDTEELKSVWDFRMDIKSGQDRKKVHFSADIAEAGDDLAGKAEYTERKNNQTSSMKITAEMKKEKEGEYSGILEIANYSGKIEKNRISLQMKLEPGEKIPLRNDEAYRILDLNSTEGEKAWNDLQVRLNQLVIQSILKKPETDLVYLSDGIPLDDWNEIIR